MSDFNSKIYLFTQSFPYYASGENTFLQYEIEYLRKSFDEIVIFPSIMTGRKQKISDSIIIDDFINEIYISQKHKSLFNIGRALFSFHFISEILINPSLLRSTKKLLNSILYLSFSLLLAQKFKSKFRKVENDRLIFYTYWCTSTTLGIALALKRNKIGKIISRAHGIDLYEERGNVYFREQTLRLIDKFLFISENGLKYESNLYKKYSSKFALARLGITNNYNPISEKTGKSIKIVSCSNIDANKQVHLIFEAIDSFSKKNVHYQIEWHHFGDGPSMILLEAQTKKAESKNLKTILHGFVTNEVLLKFYQDNYIDLFINSSLSEGLPVSIMEAQSFGIPVIAPSVGGIPEIVNNINGRLLPVQINSMHIEDAIDFFINRISSIKIFRRNSHITWFEMNNAERNYPLLVTNLNKLF